MHTVAALRLVPLDPCGLGRDGVSDGGEDGCAKDGHLYDGSRPSAAQDGPRSGDTEPRPALSYMCHSQARAGCQAGVVLAPDGGDGPF